MLSGLTTRLVSSLSLPIAELSSSAPTSEVKPTSLQLALIGAGTLAAYALLKRARATRLDRRIEVTRQALDAVTAHAPAPHFTERPTPALVESAEDAA